MAKCSYCYLPSLSYELGVSVLEVVDSSSLIRLVESHPEFTPGKNGTIISLGCYSECWDESVRQGTLELIEYFLIRKNSVQFATKRYVSHTSLEKVVPHISWKGQLCIFISSSTISKWESVERGTESPKKRFEGFKLTERCDIPTYLYLKPILNNVTINDLDGYLDVLKKYKINGVVVGGKFTKSSTLNNDLAPIGEGLLQYCNYSNDEDRLLFAFSNEVDTYTQSIQAVKYWRQHAKE
jgi:DNA repair photolyase